MRRVKVMLWAVALMRLSACASDKAPAEQAIKAAEAAVGEVRTEGRESGCRTRCGRSRRRSRP